MDPPSPWSNGYPVGEEPQLWRDWIDSFPLHHSQDTQPELGPVWSMACTSKLIEHAPCFDHAFIFFTRPEQSEYDVGHCRSEYGAFSFYVQTPSTILGVLPGEEISLDFYRDWGWDWCLGDMPGDDHPREQKIWPTIFTSPLTGRKLKS